MAGVAAASAVKVPDDSFGVGQGHVLLAHNRQDPHVERREDVHVHGIRVIPEDELAPRPTITAFPVRAASGSPARSSARKPDSIAPVRRRAVRAGRGGARDVRVANAQGVHEPER
jgi:hypothetical protein